MNCKDGLPDNLEWELRQLRESAKRGKQTRVMPDVLLKLVESYRERYKIGAEVCVACGLPGDLVNSHCQTCMLLACQRKEIERLRAIVDKLPKTADGVVVMPRDEVVCPRGHRARVENAKQAWCESGKCWRFPSAGTIHAIEECYSTREAAEAAKEKP